MFIGRRHHENFKRRKRDMLIQRDNDQRAAPQHVTPDGVGGLFDVTIL